MAEPVSRSEHVTYVHFNIKIALKEHINDSKDIEVLREILKDYNIQFSHGDEVPNPPNFNILVSNDLNDRFLKSPQLKMAVFP